MKKITLILCVMFFLPLLGKSQCTTLDATSCVCEDSGSTDCNLLPDITISWHAILNYMAGPNEYPQICTPPCSSNDGRLRVTGATPNIGLGPLTVRGTSEFVCGTDTFPSNPGPCPDGSYPRQLIKQRVYHKNGNTMTSWDRYAGGMTYHPSHGHNHVDDWVVFSLRIKDDNEPNPLNWTMVAEGGKLGFCLMDYYTCGSGSANQHCRDDNTEYLGGNYMINGDFPNFGLGGGSYGCSVVEQGISSGYEDVYNEGLDLMWINIPPGTCNGDYWIVMDSDPLDLFLEQDETNNYTAVPFTLTQQDAPGNPISTISYNTPSPKICSGGSITLKANSGLDYLWSTGDTTQTILVTTPGPYHVTVTTHCGTALSNVLNVEAIPAADISSATGDTVCVSGSANLEASSVSGTITWYDSTFTAVGLGPNYTTPVITSTSTYYVAANSSFPDSTKVGPMNYSYGAAASSSANEYLLFTAHVDITLLSVKVFASGAASRKIELRDNAGMLLQTLTTTIPDGESVVDLNWAIPAGMAYRLVGATPAGLWRNNSNSTAFPYVLPGVMEITGSSDGEAYYYYFYDWRIAFTNTNCESPKTQVMAVVSECTGIKSDKVWSGNISLFPNPASNILIIEATMPGTAKAETAILDMLGREVMKSGSETAQGFYSTSINVESLSPGLYLVSVKLDGKSYFKKLIIE